MRDLEADDSDTYTEAGNCGVYGERYAFREIHELLIAVGIEVEEIVDFFLWHDESMALGERTDIEKGKAMLVFRYFVAGDLSIDDACEYGSQLQLIIKSE